MKKINLKGISEILTEKEMKNVVGGSGISGCNFCDCTLPSGYVGMKVVSSTGYVCSDAACS